MPDLPGYESCVSLVFLSKAFQAFMNESGLRTNALKQPNVHECSHVLHNDILTMTDRIYDGGPKRLNGAEKFLLPSAGRHSPCNVSTTRHTPVCGAAGVNKPTALPVI